MFCLCRIFFIFLYIYVNIQTEMGYFRTRKTPCCRTNRISKEILITIQCKMSKSHDMKSILPNIKLRTDYVIRNIQIRKMFTKSRIIEIMLFGMVGTTAMVIHYSIYYVLLPFLPITISFSVGYLVSFLYNFMMTSYFTFKVKPTVKKFSRFATSHGINYIIQIVLLNLFQLLFKVGERVAPLFVYLISIPLNYILVRFAMKKSL